MFCLSYEQKFKCNLDESVIGNNNVISEKIFYTFQ